MRDNIYAANFLHFISFSTSNLSLCLHTRSEKVEESRWQERGGEILSPLISLKLAIPSMKNKTHPYSVMKYIN